MKTISLLFSVLLSFSLLILTSCGDDDSSSGPSTPVGASLEGTTWEQVSRVATDCSDSSDNENSTCTSDCTVLLLNNGTVEISDDWGISTVPYTVNGSNLMVDIGQGVMLDIAYVITGNTITLTYVEDSCNITEVFNAIETLELIGTSWAKVNERIANCTDSNDDCDPCNFDLQSLLLSANGSGTSITPSETQEFTYTINANMIAVEFDDNGQTITLNLEYKIIGEILVIEFTENNGCEVTEVFSRVLNQVYEPKRKKDVLKGFHPFFYL